MSLPHSYDVAHVDQLPHNRPSALHLTPTANACKSTSSVRHQHIPLSLFRTFIL